MSETTGTYDYDVAVIGGGSAGYAAARTAAGAGLRVAVIDGGKELGGLCILRGCMPSKALLYAAEVMHLCQQAGTWGVTVKEARFDFAAVMARKDALIKEFADYRRQQLNEGAFELIRAQAQFVGPHALALSNGRRVTARSLVVASGSVLAAPPLPALSTVGFISSDEALVLKAPPRSLIALGGGLVAVELAQFFARFGVKVTLVQRSAHVLKEFDPDAAEELEKALRREGLLLYTGTELVGAGRAGDRKTVSFRHQGGTVTVEAEEILLALGRVPNTECLGLAAAGVKTEHGRIVTDGRMQTSVPHIFAAGDCTSPHEIVHIAVQQGELAGYNIAHPFAPRRMDDRLLVSVVFTDPQVARVGLTEQEAAAKGAVCLCAKYPFNDHGKSIIMNTREGFVKLLANPATGEILGGTCVGPMGGELIHEIMAAMGKRMTVQELAALPHYHPTLAEIWTYPAEELAGLIVHLAKKESAGDA
jgi:pyruvate/2-oxoglutarate dehydrogenase complex dihydrolipoamide dehydrogenase (E3) component